MTTSFAPCKQPLTNTHLWHVVNGRGLKVGHAASRIARLLIGKHKPTYNPAFDGGDYVVVTNAEKLIFTGDKWNQKLYRWHTGYPGGLKEVKAKDMLYRHPDAIIRTAVSKMLPKNKLRWERLKRLRVFVGEEHPHSGQVSQGYHYQIEPQQPRAIDPALAAFREQVLADPDAFVRKYGGGKVSFVPDGQTLTVVATKIKGTHAHAVRSFGNTRSLRDARLDRLRKVVGDIQSAQAREAAKRDPL